MQISMLFEKLAAKESRYDELTQLIADTEQKRWNAYSFPGEKKGLEVVVTHYRTYKRACDQLKENQRLLETATDPEIRSQSERKKRTILEFLVTEIQELEYHFALSEDHEAAFTFSGEFRGEC